MLKHFFTIFSISICIMAASCKKSNITEEQLPPITQTGANTFGCLINGKLYIPKGFEQNKPNFDIIVDPGFSDGIIDIRVFRKEDLKDTKLNIGLDSATSVGNYTLNNRTDFSFRIFDISTGNLICSTPYSFGTPNEKNGFVKITKYDLVNRIISGEFEFHFINNDCGIGNPIQITQGRFDKKF